MKKISKFTMIMLALVALGFGCEPEGVDPGGKKANPGLKAADSDAHPALDPVCGEAKVYQLVSEDGSLNVNRCFGSAAQGWPSIACPAVTPQWGTVTMMNGTDKVIADYDLALGWFVQAQYDRFGPASSFTFDSNGWPVMDNDWNARVINPVVSKWQVARMLNTTGDHFGMATKINVVKLSLNGQTIPNSGTTLWLKDMAASEPGKACMAKWDRNWCTPAWPASEQKCALVNVGNPGLSGCTNLTPAVTNTTGTVTYAWSNGATTPSIQVCATSVTTYSVSISDANGPVAVYDYNVNVRNVSCTPGNSNNLKVNVCHIPPGNPNNPQEICISWSGVPAHVAEYRPAGSQQGHDSGCQIGRCGSNPCQ